MAAPTLLAAEADKARKKRGKWFEEQERSHTLTPHTLLSWAPALLLLTSHTLYLAPYTYTSHLYLAPYTSYPTPAPLTPHFLQESRLP